MSKLCFEFSYKCLNFCVYKGSPSNLSSALVYVPLRVLELKWRENVAKVQCSAAFLTESHSAWARVVTKVTAQASIAIVQNRYIFVLCVMKSRKEKKGFTLYGSIGHSGRWAQHLPPSLKNLNFFKVKFLDGKRCSSFVFLATFRSAVPWFF